MSAADHPVNDNDLHAHVDGRLSSDRADAVRAYLDQNPDEAARVAQYIEQRRQLRDNLQPKLDEPVPLRLRVDWMRADRRRRRRDRVANLAAVAAVAALCVVTGWFAYPYVTGGRADILVSQAMDVRNGGVHADQLPADPMASAPAARDEIVATTLAVPVKVPDLGKAGFTLSGIAVYPDGAQGHAVQLSYRDAGGRLFTVYLRHSVGSDRFDLEKRGTTQVCIWQNEDLSAVMLGEMPAKEMLKIATLTYADLSF